MGFFALFGNRLVRRFFSTKPSSAQGSPFAPHRLERRRLLDAGAAGALLGPIADVSDFVQVGASLSEQETAMANEAAGGPSNVEIFLGAVEIEEHETLQLAVMFDNFDPSDPNLEGTHRATIDWGDNSPMESIQVNSGVRSFSTSHQYLDDDPTGTPVDSPTISVVVFDELGNQATATAQVQVNNVRPTIEFMRVSRPLEENEVAQLELTIGDQGTRDSHIVEIDWGDDSPLEIVELEPRERSLLATHRYLDDPDTPSESRQVRVKVIDDDGGFIRGKRTLIVNNVPPTIEAFELPPEINEDSTATLQLTIADQGTLDTHTVQIDWGDGTPIETVELQRGEFSLTRQHQYLDDDPTGTTSDSTTVRVTVLDDDGGTVMEQRELLVKNVAPVLVVAENQEVDEGELLDLTGGGLGSFTDVGTRDTHTATVSWGDGTPTEAVTVEQATGTLSGSHRYADNGTYSVRVALRDDDGGVTVRRFLVQVNNVDPDVINVFPTPEVDEGESFTLSRLGIALADLGFDNPFNPNEPGGSEEVLTGLTVDWGDGTGSDPLRVVNRTNGGPGVPTTAEFRHAPHTYADNGLYTVTITVSDDDGGAVERQFRIQVNNVAPTLVLTERDLAIDEGDTLDLFDLGEFSDPGFNNPLNTGDPDNGAEVVESFRYTINWGDGTVETGQLPAEVVSGSVDLETLGTLVDSHLYLDNDADNLYTITVTLTDDDGGSVTESIVVLVSNVDPTLPPITATDVNTKGETTLTIEFADPGTETLTVWIDWGDKLELPPQDRFVPETFVLGPGTNNLVLTHTYDGPPDPLSPASDILISAFIRDDDFGQPAVFDPGQSVTQAVAISNPGSGTTPIVIDTTPQVPRLVFPPPEEVTLIASASDGGVGNAQTADLRTAVGDTKSATDRFLELRVIDPSTGELSEGYRLKPEVLNDLPALFKTLPDNRYAIYLVRTETNTRRLVIEVYVRNGKLIDPGDDSEGTRDRPPTDDANNGTTTEPSDELQLKEPQGELERKTPPLPGGVRPEEEPGEQGDAAPSASLHRSRLLLGTTLVGLVASNSGSSWAERIDRAVAAADAWKWQRLRRRYRYKRKNG